MSDSKSMKRWSRWALGLLALGVGCDPVVEPQQDLVRVEATAQVQQATTTTVTLDPPLNWPSNLTATGDICRFGDTSQGHQVATNTRASGRIEESFTITGLAGRRITSIRLNNSSSQFKYDDVMLLAYNNHLLMASDRRVAQYSASPAALGTSPVLYSWSNILNGLIDNQNAQSPWCSSGATTCSVPRTETNGPVDVNIPSFRSVDEAAYPSAPDSRTFRLVTIGDDEAHLDCRHGPISLTITVTHEPATCANTPAQCGTENIPGDSCGHIKTSNPSAADGVYWVKTTTGKTRVYCDMLLNGGTELCRDGVEQEVTGRTRDGSNLNYRMRSILRPSQNVCEMWAIRAAADNTPFDKLLPVSSSVRMSTCQALGFRHDGVIGDCDYGSQYSNCGFTSASLYRYGNFCPGCQLNGYDSSTYVRQGPHSSGHLISDMSGTIRTTCTVSPTSCDSNPSQCGTSASTAALSCSHIYSTNRSAPDGLYWITRANGTAMQAYCDMHKYAGGYELCTEDTAERFSRTRSSNPADGVSAFRMTSVLSADKTTCRIWALRTFSNHPFDRLYLVGGNTLSTCQAFGFKGDGTLGICNYGSYFNSTCGFTGTTYFRMGNSCPSCSQNPGDFSTYQLQGNIYSGKALSNMSGTIFTTCRTTP